MKKYMTHVVSLLAASTLMLAALPGAAADIDVRVALPGVVVQTQPVYVQPRPVYVREQYENDWRARQVRALAWRDNPDNHGQSVSAAVHKRNDARKGGKRDRK